ncbi:SPOR domain-containing protein [Magnetococcus sp. PR-3]|uniref:SPOR domain-containing protein n=1 Tax=Magnetococcus sp. PR-3 TaxID=3120355 RepID=UPI002FCDF99F
MLPWVVAAILAVIAVAFLWDGMRDRPEEGADAVWAGEKPVLSRAMALPERMLVELEGLDEQPRKVVKKRQAVKPAPLQPSPPKQKLKDLPPPPAMVRQPRKPLPKPPTPIAGSQYIVQVGSFVYEFGAGQLVERLKQRGYEASVLEATETVVLNQVQAGPYEDLESAKENELKLRAGGFRVDIEKNWQGLIIPVGESMRLGYAIDIMDKAERLYVRPLRLVKAESAQNLYKVVMGPYREESEAQQMAARLSSLGRTSPLIKIWYGGGDLKAGWKATIPAQ